MLEFEKKEEYERSVRRAIGKNDSSELGSEMDQISDDDESEDEENVLTPPEAVQAVVNTYKVLKEEEPPEEMGYHLTAISLFLGIGIDMEMFGERKQMFGPTQVPESKSTSTQTPPQPVPTTREAATDPPPAPPAKTYAIAATTGTNICDGSGSGVNTTGTSETHDEQCLHQHRPPSVIPATPHGQEGYKEVHQGGKGKRT